MTKDATNAFLNAIVPQGQTLCLARDRTMPDPGRPKLSWQHQFIGPRAEKARAAAIQMALDSKDTNSYFAVASYDGTGKRKADNVVGIKTLFLDIDIGKGEGFFTTKAEVLPALKTLHTAVPDLPAPWIVDSGNGVHIYYELSDTLTRAQWAPLASLFAAVVKAVAPKLIADPVRTKDIASVMRLPGSWNAKQLERKSVRELRSGNIGSVAAVQSALAKAALAHHVVDTPSLVATELVPGLPPRPDYMSIDDTDYEFGGGTWGGVDPNALVDLNLRPILEGCQQMRDIFSVKGNVPEPAWMLYLRVLLTVKGADDVACAFSEGHPTYSEAGTRRKLRHIRQNFDTPTAGCKEFKDLNPGACRGCPNAKRVFLPSQLALLAKAENEIKGAKTDAAESAAESAVNPSGYITQPSYVRQGHGVRGAGEITFLPVRQPGQKGAIVSEPVLDSHLHLVRSSVQLSSIIVDHHETVAARDTRVHMDAVTHGMVSRVVASQRTLSGTGFDKATEPLRDAGVVFETAQPNQRAAGLDYLHNLVSLSGHNRAFFRPDKGWRKVGRAGDWTFVSGSRHYRPGGIVENNVTSAEHRGLGRDDEGFMERACSGFSHGKLDQWQRGMSIYDGKRMAVAQLLLLSGLSNMLLPLLSSNKGGILLALTGGSGAGKTTLVDFMASFMGDFGRYKIPGDSTPNAIGALLGQANCMMVVADDSVINNGEVFSTLLTLVTGGSEKLRLAWDSQAGGSVPYSEGFNASLLLTSNASTTATIGRGSKNGGGQLQSEAARTRTLEFPAHAVKAPSSFTSADWAKAKALIGNNYGHAFDRFIRYVVDNQTRVIANVQRLEVVLAERLHQHMGGVAAGQSRFWAKFLAVTGVTAKIVCSNLNLLHWDHTEILRAGEAMVADTVLGSREADGDLTEALWDVCITEPHPNNPVINYVPRKTHRHRWGNWKTDTRSERMGASEWVNSAKIAGDKRLAAASDTNWWRVDTYDVTERNKDVTRERVIYIPIRRIKALVQEHRGDELPVSDWADLYNQLISAGCKIYGVRVGRPDRAASPAVRVGLGLRQGGRGFARSVIEIRLPPQTLA